MSEVQDPSVNQIPKEILEKIFDNGFLEGIQSLARLSKEQIKDKDIDYDLFRAEFIWNIYDVDAPAKFDSARENMHLTIAPVKIKKVEDVEKD